jgi:ribosomal protein S18 acetylase RimI-like enzyme
VYELDNPVWWAMTGSQRDLGATTSLAARFHPDISPFGGLSDEPTGSHWEDLAGLVGPRETVALIGVTGSPSPGWTVLRELAAVQMVDDQISRGPEASAAAPGSAFPAHSTLHEDAPVPLGRDDVAEMLALAAVARPGPFLPRTVEFGGYFGIRRQGRLVAMAGERLRPPGYTEVSAVATAPDHRRQGLAWSLVGAVVTAIHARGEIPFLHAERGNAAAIRLYESMGFSLRKTMPILLLQSPAAR